ncbi:hypothetical protein RCL1_006156 [Eukaryota sp. TZLM3-RCL]
MKSLLFVTCLLVVALAYRDRDRDVCPPTEREALMKLSDALGGDKWTKKWNNDNDICKWHGIECRNGHVSTIDLQNNNLEGELPVEIGCFPSLRTLYLQKNKIRGEIPEEVARLTDLKHVDLSENKLTGRIPKGFCDLYASLQFLYLNNNFLSGRIPECFDERFSKSLKTVRLQCNDIRGKLPQGFQKMNELRELWIHCTEMEEVEEVPPQLISFKQGDLNCEEICPKKKCPKCIEHEDCGLYCRKHKHRREREDDDDEDMDEKMEKCLKKCERRMTKKMCDPLEEEYEGKTLKKKMEECEEDVMEICERRCERKLNKDDDDEDDQDEDRKDRRRRRGDRKRRGKDEEDEEEDEHEEEDRKDRHRRKGKY